MFSRCESDLACHSAFPEVRTEFASLLERLGNEPVVIEWDGGTLTLTRDLFAAKVEDMTRDSEPDGCFTALDPPGLRFGRLGNVWGCFIWRLDSPADGL